MIDLVFQNLMTVRKPRTAASFKLNPGAVLDGAVVPPPGRTMYCKFGCSDLKELGYQVLEASDGPVALAILEKQEVDLVFTDVVLPKGLTGADIVARAKALQPKIKTLFTTGYSRNAIVHQGRLDRGVQLITKPFTFEDLAAKVREVLDKPS